MAIRIGDQPGTINRAVSAAGATSATATVLNADHCMVTSITAGTADGVRMQAGNANELRTVINGTSKLSGSSLRIYPPTGAQFNNQTADDPIVLPPSNTAMFVFLNAANIFVNAG